MNYDTMTVDELRNHYDILLLEEAILKKLGTVEALMNLETDKELVFAALRKAAVREASVGKLVFGTHEIPDVVNTDLSHIETTIRFDWCENERHPDALTEDLLLIPTPKETP